MGVAAGLSLLTGMARGKTPLRTGYYALMTRLSRLFRTDRRYEFERLYAEKGDPWGYFTRPYEHEKYRQTLQFALEHCGGTGLALEVGCSVGVFTKLMAEAFDNVLAIDLSREALRIAERELGATPNVELRPGDFLALDLGRRAFDVIFFAEVLYYVPDERAADVCHALEHLLTDRGVFVVVHPAEVASGPLIWDGVLSEAFDKRAEVTIEDPKRPYVISIFGRQEAMQAAA
jgi:SAM-dependent methyltransferase